MSKSSIINIQFSFNIWAPRIFFFLFVYGLIWLIIEAGTSISLFLFDVEFDDEVVFRLVSSFFVGFVLRGLWVIIFYRFYRYFSLKKKDDVEILGSKVFKSFSISFLVMAIIGIPRLIISGPKYPRVVVDEIERVVSWINSMFAPHATPGFYLFLSLFCYFFSRKFTAKLNILTVFYSIWIILIGRFALNFIGFVAVAINVYLHGSVQLPKFLLYSLYILLIDFVWIFVSLQVYRLVLVAQSDGVKEVSRDLIRKLIKYLGVLMLMSAPYIFFNGPRFPTDNGYEWARPLIWVDGAILPDCNFALFAILIFIGLIYLDRRDGVDDPRL